MRNDLSHDRHPVGGGEPDAIRAADADRDATAALLRKHHVAGRLTDHELQDRLDRTMAARTLGELRALMADLPRPALHPLARLGQAWRRGELVLPRFVPRLAMFALLWGALARQVAWHHHYWHHHYWHHHYYAYYAGYHHDAGTWFPPLWLLIVLGFVAFRLLGYRGRHGRGPARRARWV